MYPPINRTYLHHAKLDKANKSYGDNDNIVPAEGALSANLIASVCDDGMHAPVIDIDYPIEVYPSSQIGHYHIYFNKKISFDKYKQVLLALKDAGLVEPGYADASIAKGYSAVRPPGVTKPGIPPNAKKILEENALLRKQVYELKSYIMSTHNAEANSHQSTQNKVKQEEQPF